MARDRVGPIKEGLVVPGTVLAGVMVLSASLEAGPPGCRPLARSPAEAAGDPAPAIGERHRLGQITT
jgi:hypothetical protein